MAKTNPTPPTLTKQDIQRFWDKVILDSDDESECWPYQGEQQKRYHYGVVTLCRKRGIRTRRQKHRAHRIAYFLTTGDWPPQDVCHHCDNPPCCRPLHLFAGSRSDNMHDAQQKGRTVISKGEERGNAKLNEAAVRFIKRVWSERSMFRRELAEMFGVSQGAIQNVTDGRRWKHVL